MLEQKNIIQAICIGANRYVSARGSAMYLTCLESYDGENPANEMGEYALQHRCNYEDWQHFEALKPSYLNPVVFTAQGKFEVFAGTKQLQITKILTVEPYKQQNKPVAVASSAKS